MRFRLSNGLSIRYKSRGMGRTVLLLHPVALRAEFWDPVVELLASEMRLISADTRGHGESDVPAKAFSLEDCADDFIELISAVGQPKTVVVGCSMGGMIAQGIAAKRPDLVAGCIAANTVHKRTPQSLAVYEKRAEEALKGMEAGLNPTLSRWFDPQGMADNPGAVAFAQRCLQDADPIVHNWSWTAIRNLNFAEALKKSNVPVIALAGTRDLATPLDGVKAMAADVPHCTFQAIDAGHLSAIEKPAAFAEILRGFVKSLG